MVKVSLEKPASFRIDHIDKVMAARDELSRCIIDKADEINLCLAALLCEENVLFIGPPGAAKSMLIDGVAQLVDGRKFSYTMSKFSTPEDVFGHLDLISFQKGIYVKNTKNKLADVEVAVLDEIFNSSPAIRNSLLKAINEKRFDPGTGIEQDIPLQFVLAADNRFPSGEEESEAFVDRFLFRKEVTYIRGQSERSELVFNRIDRRPMISPMARWELESLRRAIREIPWETDAKRAFLDIVKQVNAKSIYPSDRRLYKAYTACQASSAMSGGNKVMVEDLAILAHILWTTPERQPSEVSSIVFDVANPSSSIAIGRRNDAEKILSSINMDDMLSITKASEDLKAIVKYLKTVKDNSRGDVKEACAYIKERLLDLRRAVLDRGELEDV